MITRPVSLVLLAAACVLPAWAGVPVHFAELLDTDGQRHSDAEWRGKKAIVLEFIEVDCPLANQYVPEMRRLASRFREQGVAFYAVLSSGDEAEKARDYAREFAYTFPILLDPTQSLARGTGATVTPEVAVISPAGNVLYRGRIDDRSVGLGKQRAHPTRRDLEETLDAIVLGKPPAPRITKTIGCFIDFK